MARPDAVAEATKGTAPVEATRPALDSDNAARVAALVSAAAGAGDGSAGTGDGSGDTRVAGSGDMSVSAVAGAGDGSGDVRVAGSGDASVSAAAGGDAFSLDVDLELLTAELCAYQSSRLASRYLDFLETVAPVDRSHGDGTGRLTEAAARGYFKLLAYKDEYEVARLMLDPVSTAEARKLAAATGGRLAWKLHPPLLRVLFLKSKISFSTKWTPMFRLLAAMRGLRGTPFDLFGYTKLRRAERSLHQEYRMAMETAVAELADHPSSERYERAVELAEIPESVRGYEDLKMERIRRARRQLSQR